MQYPSNWELLPPTVLALENVGNRIVEFVLLSNKLDPLGSRNADLSISVENVSKYLDTNTMKIKSKTIQEYVSGEIGFINSQGSSILSLTYVRDEPTEISGLPAWRIDYTSSFGYEITTYVIKDNRLFTFDFYSDQLKAPEMLPIAQKMIDSFQFL